MRGREQCPCSRGRLFSLNCEAKHPFNLLRKDPDPPLSVRSVDVQDPTKTGGPLPFCTIRSKDKRVFTAQASSIEIALFVAHMFELQRYRQARRAQAKSAQSM